MIRTYTVTGGVERTFEINVQAESAEEAEDMARYQIEETMKAFDIETPVIYVDGVEELDDYEEI